jgi:predicted SAM-dependent methyltransferase
MRLRLKNFVTNTHSRVRRHVATMPSPRYLNLGSGPRGIASPEWLNIDGYLDKNVQFRLDFSRPFPFEDECFDGVFCEHVLEHFDMENGQRLIAECNRILKPNGTVRFIMPNAETIMRAYVETPDLLVEKRQPSTNTAMQSVNMWFRQRYEHECLYDPALARIQFEKAGFSRVDFSAYRKSDCCPESLLLDDEKYAWESIYIDAVK